MAQLHDLPLIDATVLDTSTFSDAIARLFDAQVPALAVVDADRRLLGVISELDVLRALFPRYLTELQHTAFLTDVAALDQRAFQTRDRPALEFARTVDLLDADESETHAAERFLHTGEQALPVVEGERFLGMLSIAALCYARDERLRAV